MPIALALRGRGGEGVQSHSDYSKNISVFPLPLPRLGRPQRLNPQAARCQLRPCSRLLIRATSRLAQGDLLTSRSWALREFGFLGRTR